MFDGLIVTERPVAEMPKHVQEDVDFLPLARFEYVCTIVYAKTTPSHLSFMFLFSVLCFSPLDPSPTITKQKFSHRKFDGLTQVQGGARARPAAPTHVPAQDAAHLERRLRGLPCRLGHRVACGTLRHLRALLCRQGRLYQRRGVRARA